MRISTEVPCRVDRQRVGARRLTEREIEKWYAMFEKILSRIGHKPSRPAPLEAALPVEVSHPISIVIENGEVKHVSKAKR